MRGIDLHLKMALKYPPVPAGMIEMARSPRDGPPLHGKGEQEPDEGRKRLTGTDGQTAILQYIAAQALAALRLPSEQTHAVGDVQPRLKMPDS